MTTIDVRPFSSRSVRACVPLLCVALSLIGSRTARASAQDDFFDDATLHEVRLAVNSLDWETLKAHDDENTYYPADFSWNNMTVRNVGIRSRGKGTRNGLKPGLRIDVNHYVSNLQFLGLKAFVLDNAYSDATLLRESVTMKMFDRLKMPAPREAHARLYVNNEYAGAYTIVESIDSGFISRVFGEKEGGVESGGYLFEYEHTTFYNMEYLGSDLREYAAILRPQTHQTDAVATLYEPIEAMIRTINESSDDEFGPAVGQYLDLRQFVKYLAIETFMGESDGLVGLFAMNNFYLYRFRQDRRSLFIPWDKDSALQGVDVPVTARMDMNVLVRRAMTVPDLRQAFLDTLLQCVAVATEPGGPDDPRGWLEREIDRQSSQIAAAVAADPVYPFSYDRFADDLVTILGFGRSRPLFVTCEVARMDDSTGSDQSCAHVLDDVK